MIAPCGFRCDRCLAFVGIAKTHADRVRGSGAWARYYGLQVIPQRMRCHGCEGGKVEGLQFPDPKCEIRPCAQARALSTCAECVEYPCSTMQARMAACDEVVQRLRGQIPDREFDSCIAPYDCRAILDGIRKKRGK